MGAGMKPHVLLFEPIVPETDAAYCVHRLFAAHDRAALIASIGSSVISITAGQSLSRSTIVARTLATASSISRRALLTRST